MINEADTNKEEFINISEILAMLKPALVVVLIAGLLCGALAYLYSKTIERQYLAVAKITIESKSGGLSNATNPLAGFIGIGGGQSERDLAVDKINSRDFIVELLPNSDLGTDPFYVGSLDPDALNADPDSREYKRLMQRVVARFRRSVTVRTTINGIINIQVVHTDPDRAASIANLVADTHLANLRNKQDADGSRQTELVAKRLREAKQTLDDAIEEARAFAIENSFYSNKALGNHSLRLDRFRQEIGRLNAILEGINYLTTLRKDTSSETFDLDIFLIANPAAAQLQQELDMTEGRKKVSLPSLERLAQLEASFSAEREQFLRAEELVKNDASQSARAASQLLKLEGNVEINKLLYSGLVTQFEARSLSDELSVQMEHGQRIQTATAPMRPSSPRVLNMVLGWGIFGAIVALIGRVVMSTIKGQLYSAKGMAQASGIGVLAQNVRQQTGLQTRVREALGLSSKQRDNADIVELALALREDNIGMVSLLGAPASPVGQDFAAVLGQYLASPEARIAVVDLTRMGSHTSPLQSHGIAYETESQPQVTHFSWIESPEQDGEMLSFSEALARIEEEFDTVIVICAPMDVGVLQNRRALESAGRIFVLTTPGVTQRKHLETARSVLSKAHKSADGLVVA